MTSVPRQSSAARGAVLRRPARGQGRALVRAVAQPSLVQLVLRFALAVPFWRSGILKWDGFFRLNDTAVTLFTDEFMLHLPGGPYPFPAPTVMAFLSGCGGDHLPHPSRARLCDALCGARPPVHDPDRRTDRAGRMADPHHLGGDGARHHGVGTGARFARLFDPTRSGTTQSLKRNAIRRKDGRRDEGSQSWRVPRFCSA